MKWGFLDDDSGYFYCIIYTFSLKARRHPMAAQRMLTSRQRMMAIFFIGIPPSSYLPQYSIDSNSRLC